MPLLAAISCNCFAIIEADVYKRQGKILPRLRRAHEENQSRREKAETKAEMSRFRAFQTRINQGFFRGCQRVRDTFILFPRKRRFNA